MSLYWNRLIRLTCSKVIFSQVSVSHSVHRGGVCQADIPWQTPPGQTSRLGRYPARQQTPPCPVHAGIQTPLPNPVHAGIPPSGGSKGVRGMRAPWGPKFFQFHAVFGKIWQNHMLAPPGELAPPPRGNSGSATASSPLQQTVRILMECTLVQCSFSH